MFEPENDLERKLVRAAAEPAQWPDFFRAMFNGTTFVALEFNGAPPATAADGKLKLPEGTKLTMRTVRSGDQDYLPFFTAPSRARAAFKGNHVVIHGVTRELFERHPGKQFLLNPGQEHAREFSSDDVNRLLAGQFDALNVPVVIAPPVTAKRAEAEPPPDIRPMVLDAPIVAKPVFAEEAFVFRPMAPAASAPPAAKPAEAPAAKKSIAEKRAAAPEPAPTPVAAKPVEAPAASNPIEGKPAVSADKPAEAAPRTAAAPPAGAVKSEEQEPGKSPAAEKRSGIKNATAEALAAIRRYASTRSAPDERVKTSTVAVTADTPSAKAASVADETPVATHVAPLAEQPRIVPARPEPPAKVAPDASDAPVVKRRPAAADSSPAVRPARDKAGEAKPAEAKVAEPKPAAAPPAAATPPAPRPQIPPPPGATIGRPDPYPVDVLFALTSALQGMPAIEAAHLGQAQFPGRPPYLLVAIGSAESWEPLMQAHGLALRKALPPGSAVEFTPLTGGMFEEYFRTETHPFFKKR